MSTAVPPLGYEHTAEVLKKLANLEHQIVLVGGQAVNFWASYYEDQAPQLADHAPYTSKDIDFFGSHDAVRECAKRLGGTARLATIDDMNTPSTGLVLFVDDNNHPRQIDFSVASRASMTPRCSTPLRPPPSMTSAGRRSRASS